MVEQGTHLFRDDECDCTSLECRTQVRGRWGAYWYLSMTSTFIQQAMSTENTLLVIYLQNLHLISAVVKFGRDWSQVIECHYNGRS